MVSIIAKEEYSYNEARKERFFLSNENCSIEYDVEDKKISGNDHTDQNNLPAFYTESRRGLAKAWEDLKNKFNAETTMYDAERILWENKIRSHSWCRMD